MSTLPPSGISAHQDIILYPEGVNENWGPEQDNDDVQQEDMRNMRNKQEKEWMMKLYSTQMFLRVVLNVAHNALYGPSGRMSFDPTNAKDASLYALSHVEILQNWRGMLSPELAWKDKDPPSTDLNIARVRAKYYGGLYMMLRPYLRLASHVLEFPPPPPGTTGASQQNSPSASAYGTSASNRYVQMVELTSDQKKIIDVACTCINSAIQSTIAFDRVGADPNSPYANFAPTRTKRLVVTNIFGTLHA
jgi:hypothetical protein